MMSSMIVMLMVITVTAKSFMEWNDACICVYIQQEVVSEKMEGCNIKLIIFYCGLLQFAIL